MTMHASLIGLGNDIATNQLVILDGAARNLSTYIIGKPGTGKSKLLEHIAYQDMLNGDGLLFLDPHADSVELLLSLVPSKREKDVIWWDPTGEGPRYVQKRDTDWRGRQTVSHYPVSLHHSNR